MNTDAATFREDVRRLSDSGMEPASRLAVMIALLDGIARDTRYELKPDAARLQRLAAHALAWAEALER